MNELAVATITTLGWTAIAVVAPTFGATFIANIQALAETANIELMGSLELDDNFGVPGFDDFTGPTTTSIRKLKEC